MAAGRVSLKKSHDIIILSFCNIAKGQANSIYIYLVMERIPESRIGIAQK